MRPVSCIVREVSSFIFPDDHTRAVVPLSRVPCNGGAESCLNSNAKGKRVEEKTSEQNSPLSGPARAAPSRRLWSPVAVRPVPAAHCAPPHAALRALQ